MNTRFKIIFASSVTMLLAMTVKADRIVYGAGFAREMSPNHFQLGCDLSPQTCAQVSYLYNGQIKVEMFGIGTFYSWNTMPPDVPAPEAENQAANDLAAGAFEARPNLLP